MTASIYKFCLSGTIYMVKRKEAVNMKLQSITEKQIQKFRKYLSQLVKNTKKYYQTDMIFVFAWNEWAEGGYLEPDEKHGYGFLKAIKDSLNDCPQNY